MHRTCGPPLPFVSTNQNTTDKAEKQETKVYTTEQQLQLKQSRDFERTDHFNLFLTDRLPPRVMYDLFIYAGIKNFLISSSCKKSFHQGPLTKWLPPRNVPLMTEQ